MASASKSAWFFLVAVIAVSSSCRSLPERGAALKLRVVTYNIHHAEGVDQRFDCARIARVILDAAPDLVALQEVDQKTRRASGVDQAAELSRLTGMQVVFGKALDYAGGGYGNAVLSRWLVLESTNFALPSTEGHEPRAALAIKTRPPGTKQDVWFVSTHLDHTRDEAERLRQAHRLNELLARDDGQPVILAGDLNAVPESRVMEVLLRHWSDAAVNNPQPTVPSVTPRNRIDYVLLRPAGAWRVIQTQVLDEAVASDHRAVFAELEWSPKLRGP